jgi:hypothetical protein
MFLVHQPSALDEMKFLTVAYEADPMARESLWRTAATAGKSADTDLRVALLQSLPGHSGYDPLAARERLQQLASKPSVPPEIGAVARLRLAHLEQDAALAAEVAQLKQRLARVVEIEKRLNGKENGK